MRARYAILATAMLAGCSTVSLNQPSQSANAQRPEAALRRGTAMSIDRYKQTLAHHVVKMNPDKIYPGNPQAMLRSVVVIKFVLDSNGSLIRSDTLRTNGDSAAEKTALSALRKAAPYPHPPMNLLSQGRLELLETMLFNDDGRFQLRSIAAPQMEE